MFSCLGLIMSVAKKSKPYYYHDKWEHDYFFTICKNKCCCLISASSVAIPKRVKTMHAKYDTENPRNTDYVRLKLKI